MRRPTDIDTRSAAIDRLHRAGVAAMPDPSTVAEQHLGLMSVALASQQQGRIARTTTRPGRRIARRRLVVVGAMAAFVAIPSLAFAGALPDPVQRVASKVAAAVGVDLPTPPPDVSELRAGSTGGGGSGSGDRTGADSGRGDAGRGSDDARGDSAADAADSDERGHVNGAQPGKPEDGEQRGNRFGCPRATAYRTGRAPLRRKARRHDARARPRGTPR